MTREEAIKIIKEFVNGTCLHLVDQEALETLIPELKESDDERMLQTIIKGFENCKRNGMATFNNTKIDDILVYLEKQKEQQPVEWEWPNLSNCIKNCKKCHGKCFYRKEPYEEQKLVECIKFDNEFDNQVSHLLASVLNGEHKYNKDFVKYASQSLLGYAKNELKSDELNEREKLMKALQTTNAQIGELVEENYKLKEQKPAEINEYEIIKKHITEDFLSSEVNKRLKECGWYVTDEKPAEWDEDYNEENIQTRFAFYTYKDDPCTLYLSNVFVEETSRNKGFGTKILTAAEKVAETLGVTYIRLKVKQGSPTNAWYRKNGYGYVAFEDGYDWLEKNLEYMKPNKQEWDKFDEDCLKRTVWYIENPAPSVVKDTNLALWLKSLPGRFNLEPKHEWSEDIADWLESFRPT